MNDLNKTFMDYYNKLEDIFREKYSVEKHGVSKYIDDMENKVFASFKVHDWKKQLKTLIEISSAKNSIKHNDDFIISEDLISSIKKFVIDAENGNDPLSLLNKKKK